MKRCKVWKLKEAETESIFRQRVQARVAMSVGKPRDAEGVWKDQERMHAERSYQCVLRDEGYISQDIKRPGGGNDEVAALVQEKSVYLDCRRVRESVSARKDAGARKGKGVELASVGKRRVFFGHPQDVNADLESMKENYHRAKRAAKLAIFNANNAERLTFCGVGR